MLVDVHCYDPRIKIIDISKLDVWAVSKPFRILSIHMIRLYDNK